MAGIPPACKQGGLPDTPAVGNEHPSAPLAGFRAETEWGEVEVVGGGFSRDRILGES
jgi:hypothetical protein